MTRVLGELLGRSDAAFQLGLQQLEHATGRPGADIRLTVEVQNRTRQKLQELQLDPHDTTGQESYAALGQKLRNDDQRLAAALSGSAGTSTDPIEHVARGLVQAIGLKTCFALKTTIAKKLLKANVPKKTMKLLGYRSADSLLKHETAASLLATAWVLEPEQWSKKQLAQYAKLKASDFEIRKLAIEHPSAKRWQSVADTLVARRQHNILAIRELGTVVLLPLPADRPALIVLTTATLTLHAVNELYAVSTYLKMHQAGPQFGTVVKKVVLGQTTLETALLDQPVSWHLVQQYFARFSSVVQADIFEPLVQAEDFAWHSVEQVLSDIEPSLAFWQGTGPLAHMSAGQLVSLNLSDNLLSFCNRLPFGERLTHHFRNDLTTELTLRYMLQDRLRQNIFGQLQTQFAVEPALA